MQAYFDRFNPLAAALQKKPSNNEENNVNGKYIKAEIYDEMNNIDEVQYLKIEDVKYNDRKMFKIFFNTDNAKAYKIYLVNEKNQ